MTADVIDEEQRAYEEMLTGDPKPYIDELLQLRVDARVLADERDHYKAEAERWRRLSLRAERTLRDVAARAPRWERVGPRG